MDLKLITAIALATLASLAGCNNAKSPDTVANDVAAAQQASAKQVADARAEASKEDAKATDKVNDKSQDLNNVEATGAYDVAMAKAEGAHKVAKTWRMPTMPPLRRIPRQRKSRRSSRNSSEKI